MVVGTSAVLTAVFAVAGSWLGAKPGKDNEHQQWLRDRRLEKYTAYANACKYIISVRNGIQTDDAKFLESFAAFNAIDVELVASKRVRTELDRFNQAFFNYSTSKELPGDSGSPLQKRFAKAVDSLNAAFRADLKIRD